MKKIHIIGAGGVGMSALATLLVKQGHIVTGSDRTLGTINLKRLEEIGVKIFPDDGSAIVRGLDEVVYSTAVEDGHPDMVAADNLGISKKHRAAALSQALSHKKLIAVAGTCGKSSVTALLGHILDCLSFAPTCVNGAAVVGWQGAVKFGEGEYAVAEVDESDRSLVAFSPYAAIITNSSADHYSKSEMDEVFDSFVSKVPGPILDARNEHYDAADYISQNESLAVRMAVMLGADESKAREALLSFKGVERRLEKHSSNVYDDYAHNPEKLRAMISVLKRRHKGGLCVIWRPHGYTPLKKMMHQLATMFTEELTDKDKLVLLSVYDAGGTVDRSVRSEDLAALLPRELVLCVSDHDEAFDFVASNSQNYSCIVTAGARDHQLPCLAKRIAELKREEI